jgi:hypothetical protein
MNNSKFVIPIGITIIKWISFVSTYFTGHSFGGDKIISSNASIEKAISLSETKDKKKIKSKS